MQQSHGSEPRRPSGAVTWRERLGPPDPRVFVRPRRRLVALIGLPLLGIACSVRGFARGWSDTPPEAMLGWIPFAVGTALLIVWGQQYWNDRSRAGRDDRPRH